MSPREALIAQVIAEMRAAADRIERQVAASPALSVSNAAARLTYRTWADRLEDALSSVPVGEAGVIEKAKAVLLRLEVSSASVAPAAHGVISELMAALSSSLSGQEPKS